MSSFKEPLNCCCCGCDTPEICETVKNFKTACYKGNKEAVFKFLKDGHIPTKSLLKELKSRGLYDMIEFIIENN